MFASAAAGVDEPHADAVVRTQTQLFQPWGDGDRERAAVLHDSIV